MDVRKKSAILLSLYLFAFSLHKNNKYSINDEYTYNSDTYFASYNDSKIYIGTKEKIESIRDDSTNYVYVIDYRCDEDPNMRICNSYEIKNLKEMSYILKILKEYELKYPSEWNRTYHSMMVEWICHNICYDYSYEKESTQHVDLNNKDEDVKRLLKRIK